MAPGCQGPHLRRDPAGVRRALGTKGSSAKVGRESQGLWVERKPLVDPTPRSAPPPCTGPSVGGSAALHADISGGPVSWQPPPPLQNPSLPNQPRPAPSRPAGCPRLKRKSEQKSRCTWPRRPPDTNRDSPVHSEGQAQRRKGRAERAVLGLEQAGPTRSR